MGKAAPLPVDRGWAWVVMLGNFVNWLTSIAFVRALSILFPVLLRKYDQPVAVTTLAFGIAEITESTANVLVPLVFLSRFSVRALCVGGALVHAVSIMSLALAPNVVLVNVLFGCIGFSRGFVLNPQVYILGCYFKRRLSFASACANMGISVATLVSPLATRVVLDAYGLEGTFTILGAVSLHAVVASLLFRPPSTYQNDVVPDTEDNDNKEKDNVITEDGTQTERSLIDDTQGQQLLRLHNEKDVYFKPDADEQLVLVTEKNNKNGADSTTPEIVFQTDRKSNKSGTRITITSPDNESSTAENEEDDERSHNPEGLVTADDTADDYKSPVNDHDKTQSLLQHSRSQKTAATAAASNFSFKQWLRHKLSQMVCAQPVALLLIIASGLGVHTQAGNVYLPVLGLENGLTDDQLPWLLTITGATDIFGKLSIGLLADKGFIPVLFIACITQTIPGIALQMAPLYQGMGAMASLCAMYGLTAGILHILLPTLIVQMADLPSLPRVISGYFLLNCIVTFTMHVVVGVIKDTTGSFVGGFQYVGCLFLASVVVLLLILPVSKKSFGSGSNSRCRLWPRKHNDDSSEATNEREAPS